MITILNSYQIDDCYYMKNELSKEDELALELAKALHDTGALMLYQTFTKTHPEKVLRDILKKVLEIPKYKIRKTRGAYFNYLIQQYAHNKNYNSGH